MDDFTRSSAFDNAVVSVWRQTLVEAARTVMLDGAIYSVRRTPKHGLAQVDFKLEGQTLRGLEQNPRTNSRWAQLARKGARVMQFLAGGRYLAVVADGKVIHYSGSRKRDKQKKNS